MMDATERIEVDAQAIWQAGVDAVKPQRLFADKTRVEGTDLWLDSVVVDLRSVRRLVVVGAGKAAATMATALHEQILSRLPAAVAGLPVTGWINCPQGTCETPLPHIHLHAARPAGMNSPTPAAVAGTQRILELLASCQREDLVICLISGGGSALLVQPLAGITLEDKQAVAAGLAAAGGNIEQLNCVRRAISAVKGGGLARACRAARLVTVVISDVIGDPLETIASGPTWLETPPDPNAALQVLHELELIRDRSLKNVIDYLQSASGAAHRDTNATWPHVEHVILGNNADAVDAAGVRAVELGYRYVMQAAQQPEGDVLQVAQQAAQASLQVAAQTQIDCWISGGEPTVRLPAEGSGKGGRNQQLTLAVMQLLAEQGWPSRPDLRPLTFLSGGTDGEDGPTDAAGACCTSTQWERSEALGLSAADYLRRADAYRFFEQVGGLLRTGPTGTNVCDLRVALAGRARH